MAKDNKDGVVAFLDPVLTGRRTKVMESSLFSEKDSFGDNETLDVSDAEDKVRSALGAYYTEGSFPSIAFFKKSLNGLINLKNIGTPQTDPESQNFFGGLTQRIIIGPNKKHLALRKTGDFKLRNRFNKSQFKNLFLPRVILPSDSFRKPTVDINFPANAPPIIVTSGEFTDHAFEIDTPMPKKELEEKNAVIGFSIADIKPVYNFFINNYETVINSPDAHETLLPNMYAFLTEIQNESTDAENTIFNQHITLSGKIPDVFVDVTNNKGEKIGEKDKGQYFDKFARTFNELIRLGAVDDVDFLRTKFTNLAVPISNIDLFKSFNEKRELFPMYFDISFSTDRSTEFAESLKDAKLSSVLIKDIVDENLPMEPFVIKKAFVPPPPRRTTFPRRSSTFDRIRQPFRDRLRRQVRVESQTLRSWDLTSWIEKISKNPVASFTELESGTFLGTYNEELQMTTNEQYNLFKNLLVYIFAGKMKKLIKDRMRTYEEIIAGQEAYSETVFYGIEKFDEGTGELLQKFYLPNSNEIEILRFIDTQVKYNKQYKYKINAYQMVIGNKYAYRNTIVGNEEAQVDIRNEPSVKLVEMPYYEFTGRIMDSPPIFPDINFIPFRAVNNRVLFNLNSNVGRYFLEPIIIEESDTEIINQLREAQDADEDDFLRYESDDRATAFEIFRVTKKPRSYNDFSGKRIALVKTDVDSLTLQTATAASFVDNILPNRKYYYTFRTIDNHGHISNPTAIYEFEMVDNDGSIFPIIKVVDFDMNEELKQSTKTGKKYLHIAPVFDQIVINEEKSGLAEGGKRLPSVLNKTNFHLGFAEENIWTKTFKIRLVSKKTGKKIDLNVQFDKEHIKKVND